MIVDIFIFLNDFLKCVQSFFRCDQALHFRQTFIINFCYIFMFRHSCDPIQHYKSRWHCCLPPPHFLIFFLHIPFTRKLNHAFHIYRSMFCHLQEKCLKTMNFLTTSNSFNYRVSQRTRITFFFTVSDQLSVMFFLKSEMFLKNTES